MHTPKIPLLISAELVFSKQSFETRTNRNRANPIRTSAMAFCIMTPFGPDPSYKSISSRGIWQSGFILMCLYLPLWRNEKVYTLISPNLECVLICLSEVYQKRDPPSDSVKSLSGAKMCTGSTFMRKRNWIEDCMDWSGWWWNKMDYFADALLIFSKN